MDNYSNVYFDRRKSKVHLWRYNEDNEKIHEIHPAPLYFYVETSDDDEEGIYKTISNKPAKKVECTRWSAYKDKVESYKSWQKNTYESDVPVETKFIVSNFLGKNLSMPNLDIHFMDIEVHSEEGFPKADEAQFPITIITTYSTKSEKYIIFSEKDFDTSFMDDTNEEYELHVFDNERDLIENYVDWIRTSHPDIISGWNSNGYDIPYIMNRMTVLFGEEYQRRISPIGNVYSRTVEDKKTKRENVIWSIGGISLIDMLEVYQNYTFSEQESWKLDHIAEMELGENKIDYNGTLAELYNNDWQTYCEYNIHDVRLLLNLEKKKKFISLLVTFCYGCRVPFEFYQKTTRVLDGAFISSLTEEMVVLPDVDRELEINDQYVGGFVKVPIKGMHKWVVSYDATSLYPSIMMNLNISPETKVGKIDKCDAKTIMKGFSGQSVSGITVRYCDREFDAQELIDSVFIPKKYCMAANGVVYRTDIRGVIPRFVEEWFNQRKSYKKKMLNALSQGDKDAASEYDNLQLNYKILINSVYGYLGTKYSRFFDWDNAVAVTLTGRAITKISCASIESYFNSSKWGKSEYGQSLNVGNTITFGNGRDSIKLLSDDICEILRDGKSHNVRAADIVEGDVITSIPSKI